MGRSRSVQNQSKIDKRDDEIGIEDTEDGYPQPRPPGPLHKSLARTQGCFTDDKLNSARVCKNFNVDDVNISLDLNTISDDFTDGLKSNHSHTASSRESTILSFYEIDDHAMKAGLHLLDSFEKLTEYLTEPLSSDMFRKTKTARAIIVWLSQQDLEWNGYGKKNLDTPRGLLQYLKEDIISYTTCYTILCRKAGLQCAIVRGHVKAAAYEPGDEILPFASWNAVYVESGWQIVHPLWICMAVYGHNTGRWVKVEQDGKTMYKNEEPSFGTKHKIFEDLFFMPNPEKFIYLCCASKIEWQLVPQVSVVPSVDEFIKKASLSLPFFDLGFQLISEHACALYSTNGFCKIEMKAKKANAHMIVLQYELFKKMDTYKQKKSTKGIDVARMVFNSRAGELFTFDIRFPETGIYKLIIYGGPYRSQSLRLCKFELVCTQEMVGRNLLPLDCGMVGWGPGPVAVEAGLLMPSKPNGLIRVNEREKKTDVKFKVRDINEKYTAVLYAEVDGRRKQLHDKAVDVQINELSRQLVISVTLPDKGEYGLSIQHLTETESNVDSEENVCNYLISTLASTPERANVRNAKQKLKEVIEAPVEPRLWKEKIKDIQSRVQKCKKEKVADSEDEIINANEMVGFLFCKGKLRDCVLRRNVHVIRKTLAVVSLYKNRDALTKEINDVKEVEHDIVSLRGYARQVPTLEEANKEITALKHAPDEVHNTLKALLVLLGESEYYLEDWAIIQSMMKVSNHTTKVYVLGMMARIQKQDISQDRLKRALAILHRYDEHQVRKVNTDAHSFYLWIENFANALEEN